MPSGKVGDEVVAPLPADYFNRSQDVVDVRVIILDGSHLFCFVKPGDLAGRVYDDVCRRLSLVEKEYFCLEYVDSKGEKWRLDLQRPFTRQTSLSPSALRSQLRLWLAVRFYTPAVLLLQPITCTLFIHQLRKDFTCGDSGESQIVCCSDPECLADKLLLGMSSGTAAAVRHPTTTSTPPLAAVGAHRSLVRSIDSSDNSDSVKNPGFTHSTVNPMYAWGLGGYPVSPHALQHSDLLGAADADRVVLSAAVNCQRYGVKPCSVLDEHGSRMDLSVLHSGLVLLYEGVEATKLDWPLIRKLSFKRTRLLVKLYRSFSQYSPDRNNKSKTTRSKLGSAANKRAIVVFRFASRNQCKHFWKISVEYHGFFARASNSCQPEARPVRDVRRKFSMLSRGSSFRFNGLTQLQLAQSAQPDSISNSAKRLPLRHFRSLQWPTPRVRNLSALPLIDPAGYKSLTLGTVSPSEYCGQQRLTDSVQFPVVSQFNDPTDSPRTPVASQFNDPTDSARLPAVSHVNDPTVLEPASYVNVNSSDICETLPESRSSSAVRVGELAESPGSICSGQTDDSVEHLLQQLLFTELTFARDLDLIHMFVRRVERELVCLDDDGVQAVLRMLIPFSMIRQQHANLLSDLQQRPNTSESCSISKLLCRLDVSCYRLYTQLLLKLMDQHDHLFHSCAPYRQMCESFEGDGQCHLPVIHLLLKPALRLFRLQSTLSGLSGLGVVLAGALQLVSEVNDLVGSVSVFWSSACDRVKVHELRRDVVGLTDWPGHSGSRRFLLEGCLQQVTSTGSQCRMVFLMSDVLVCAWLTPSSLFHVEESVCLRGVTVSPVPTQPDSLFYFAVNNRDQVSSGIVLAANSEKHRALWIREIQAAIQSCSCVRTGALHDLEGVSSTPTRTETIENINEDNSCSTKCESGELPISMATNSTTSKNNMETVVSAVSGGFTTARMQRNRFSQTDMHHLTTIVENREYLSDGQQFGEIDRSSCKPDGFVSTVSSADTSTSTAVLSLRSMYTAVGPGQLGADVCKNNRSSHVCWRRGLMQRGAASSEADIPVLHRHLLAQCSGWLLRKFRHADGWQRLWVVLASSCLFFFRSNQDRIPLTSLPLLGYIVVTADDVVGGEGAPPLDLMHGDGKEARVVRHVLSLTYRQHCYLFAADSTHAQKFWFYQLSLAAGAHRQ